MATTWTDFLAQVRREVEESTAGVYADESFLYWANAAGDDIARRTNCLTGTVTRATVANTQVYTVATNAVSVVQMYYKDSLLERVDIRDWPEVVASGTPTRWTEFNGYVYLYPVPQVAGTLHYFYTYTPTHTSSVSATSDMPFSSKYDDAIATYCKLKANEQIGDWDARDRFLEEYERLIVNAWVQENNERGALSPSQPFEVW